MNKNLLSLCLSGAVAAAALLSGATASHASVIVSMANDYFNDFVANLPQNNPNGDWTYYANGDAQGAPTVVQSGGVSPGGLGSGWDDPNSIIGYARGGAFGLGPGGGDTINTHVGDAPGGTNPAQAKIDYNVPTTGTYNLTMNLQQAFEPSRSIRYDLYLNDFNGSNPSNLLGRIDSGGNTPGPAPGIFEFVNGVSLSDTDVLTIIVDGSGAGGSGLGTFVGYNLLVDRIPEPTGAVLVAIGLVGLAVRRRV